MRRYPYQSPALNPIWVIMSINVLVFVFALVNRRGVFDLLGLTPIDVTSQPWTILTNMFVHADIWHIFFNMLTLYFFGTFLQNLVSDRKFLLVYFGGGLLGSIAFILLAPLTGDTFATVVGASGAIFAVGGALAVLSPNTRVLIYFFIPVPLWAAVIFGFLITTYITFTSRLDIAWQAHLGGLIFGLVAGYFFRRQQYRRVRW